MAAPHYQWECLRCKHANESAIDECNSCGFTANYTVKQLKTGNGESFDDVTLSGVLLGTAIAIAALAYWEFSDALPEWVQMIGPSLLVFAIGFSLVGIFAVLRNAFLVLGATYRLGIKFFKLK